MDNTISNPTERSLVNELKEYINIITILCEDLKNIHSSYKHTPDKVAVYQMLTHEKLFLIHNKYKDSKEFEVQTRLIATLFDNKKIKDVTQHLHTIIIESKALYDLNKEEFESYNYREFYTQWIDNYKKDHYRIYKSNLDYYSNINKQGNSYKYSLLSYEKLVEEREQQRVKYSNYQINVYTNTYNLITYLEKVLAPYISCYSSSDKTTRQIMDEKYIRLTYDLCVGKQFEDILYDTYYNILNMSPIPKMELAIKKGENNRAYYIIDLLKNCVDDSHQEEWLEYILKYLGIAKGLYNSKYRTVNEEEASKKNKNFKTRIDTLFSHFDA